MMPLSQSSWMILSSLCSVALPAGVLAEAAWQRLLRRRPLEPRTDVKAENLEPALLIEEALRRLVASHAAADLVINVRSSHTRKLRGSHADLVAGLSQALSRAAWSAGAGGQLWLECRDVERGDQPYVSISVIHNGAPLSRAALAEGGRRFAVRRAKAPTGDPLLVDLQRLAAAHRGRLDLRLLADGSELTLILPAALASSRYRPQCLKASLLNLAQALSPMPRLGIA